MNFFESLKKALKRFLILIAQLILGIKGVYKFTECDASSDEAKKMLRRIKRFKDFGKDYRNILEEFHQKFTIKTWTQNNLVPDVGLNALAENLINASPSAANNLYIGFLAVGTGTVAPASSNTILGGEILTTGRKVPTQSRADNVAKNTIFLGTGDANGVTISEIGAFAGAATSTKDSGTMMSRVLLSPTFVKTSAKTLTIDVYHTFSSI